jgi:hypothetical protein
MGSSAVAFSGLTCGLRECQIGDNSTVGILVHRYRDFSISAASSSSCSSSEGGVSRTQVVVNVNGILLPFSQAAQQLISQEFERYPVSPLRLDSFSDNAAMSTALVCTDNSRGDQPPNTSSPTTSSCLYPTVSLRSSDTRVYCRFSEGDMLQRTRSSIGAPRGCRVYCLDGTLLLREQSV